MTDERRVLDWRAIEREYRAGLRSVRAIARVHQVDESAIRRRARREGWQRAARGATRSFAASIGTLPPSEENLSPAELADRGAGLVSRMLAELEAATVHRDELAELIDASFDAGDTERARRAAHSSVSLKARSEALKALASAAKAFAEMRAPAAGLKARREEAAARIAKGGGKFSAPAPPLRLVASSGEDGDGANE